MSKRLPVLCPQSYEGIEMQVVVCTRCSLWDKDHCGAYTGCEHLPLVEDVPNCPIQDRCQHELQSAPNPCPVRSRGMICESALVWGGMSENEAASHPRSFHASTVVSPEEWEERQRDDAV